MKSNYLVVVFIILSYSWITNCKKTRRQYLSRRPKPNIIFILTDDLDVTLGSPNVMKKTKRILVQEGVNFENSFTASPICCPSRSSILTGRYTHNHGVHTNTDKHCYSREWINGPERVNFGKLMQDGGYETGYFGKYLNNYDGVNIPAGWNYWAGLIKNSRYYNYTLNVNGRFRKYGDIYKRDYFTDVITTESINYFKRMKRSYNSKPVMMVLSMAAPHGPEDGAPQYQKEFKGVKAPRYPNFNFTSKDKHWIIRRTPPLNNLTGKFVDVLHRKRLQTLLSVDDAVERLYLMLIRTGQLYNTYIIFSSDHGYHLGQFNQVKGKSQPYESDIRIPLYMRGPSLARGVNVKDIALNIDLAPTILDIGGLRSPKFFDGQSLLDSAVGNIMNKMKRKVMKPFWRDTFLVSRGKLLTKEDHASKKTNIDKLVSVPSARKVQRECMRFRYPKPPCNGNKKIVCYIKGGTWYLTRCSGEESQIKSAACYCNNTSKDIEDPILPVYENATNNEISMLLLTLERQFERLKRRIKRHGVKYLTKISNADKKPTDSPDYAKQSVAQKRKLDHQETKVEKKSSKMGRLVDKKIAQTQKRLVYWKNERSKLFLNRELTKKLSTTLAERTQRIKSSKSDKDACYCNRKIEKKPVKLTKKEKKRRDRNKNGEPKVRRSMNCFRMKPTHWKSPPVWKHEAFTACTNSPNSSYWCLRTVNETHNFLYCEFVTKFKEYFDINKDPYQLTNIISSIPLRIQDQLSKLLAHLKICEGARNCFVLRGETLSDRRDVLRKIRRYERKKRHGKLIRGLTDSSINSKKRP